MHRRHHSLTRLPATAAQDSVCNSVVQVLCLLGKDALGGAWDELDWAVKTTGGQAMQRHYGHGHWAHLESQPGLEHLFSRAMADLDHCCEPYPTPSCQAPGTRELLHAPLHALALSQCFVVRTCALRSAAKNAASKPSRRTAVQTCIAVHLLTPHISEACALQTEGPCAQFSSLWGFQGSGKSPRCVMKHVCRLNNSAEGLRVGPLRALHRCWRGLRILPCQPSDAAPHCPWSPL